ncbi:hypothetical protein AO385_0080 [Moraxella catarrhalis]|uniref:Uncharacterized protein n=1 Tax=Moraxella catarrhalis TaxID=480 RepID=A0A198UDY9_MORCA|nr:hypothetical protein AO384_2005 [Moraxella catarrhalis]OAU98679.1 hypothetical protein AO383_0468 [Moraxella catarrhalis]OAV00026.1 hypothetical protein AO382_1818 [Moraxella catarrhalis]OAV04511.1 hypothetical protein AO385_0080 [Moraxella catarrhalis]
MHTVATPPYQTAQTTIHPKNQLKMNTLGLSNADQSLLKIPSSLVIIQHGYIHCLSLVKSY